jgi:hypothetical protein
MHSRLLVVLRADTAPSRALATIIEAAVHVQRSTCNLGIAFLDPAHSGNSLSFYLVRFCTAVAINCGSSMLAAGEQEK